MVDRARIQGWLEQLLHTHDTPGRTAFAFGLGVFLGFSPFLGLHAILGLILAFVLRLNRVAVLIGVYSNLPWILPAYYTVSTIGGAALLGVDIQPRVLEQAMVSVTEASWRHPIEALEPLAPYLWSFTIGSTIGALLLGGAAYRAALLAIRAHRRQRERADHHDPPPSGSSPN